MNQRQKPLPGTTRRTHRVPSLNLSPCANCGGRGWVMDHEGEYDDACGDCYGTGRKSLDQPA